MAPKKTSKVIRKKPLATSCFYCDNKKNPSYKEHEDLSKFVTDRAKMVGKVRSGLCSKHQRRFTRSVKRARHLGLLPFKAEL